MIKIHCPNCGENLEKIENFCPYCRYKFDSRMKSGSKNLNINTIEKFEYQIHRAENEQIQDLRKEVRLLKQNFLNSQKASNKKNGEVWYWCCVLIVVIYFIYHLINVFSWIPSYLF